MLRVLSKALIMSRVVANVLVGARSCAHGFRASEAMHQAEALDDEVGHGRRHEDRRAEAHAQCNTWLGRHMAKMAGFDKLSDEIVAVVDKGFDVAGGLAGDATDVVEREDVLCVAAVKSMIETHDTSMELGGVLAALICGCAAFNVANSRLSLDRQARRASRAARAE